VSFLGYKITAYGVATDKRKTEAIKKSTQYRLTPEGVPRSSSVLQKVGTGQLKCDGTRAETRFRVSAKRTSQFTSAGASVQSTAGRRGVRISGSNAGYTVFRGRVKGTGYPLHSPVSPSLPLLCVTVCHHISNEKTKDTSNEQ
jgi:hypothetical protein